MATGVDVPPVGLIFTTPIFVEEEGPFRVTVSELLAARVYSTEFALKPIKGTLMGFPEGSVKSSVPVEVNDVEFTRKMFVRQPPSAAKCARKVGSVETGFARSITGNVV